MKNDDERKNQKRKKEPEIRTKGLFILYIGVLQGVMNTLAGCYEHPTTEHALVLSEKRKFRKKGRERAVAVKLLFICWTETKLHSLASFYTR